jgi:outer membrane protein OmpA-like peptidoglycan-associated protein
MPLFVPGLTLLGELQASSEAYYYFKYENTSYLEGDLGVRYQAPFGLAATLGGGGGFLRGMGCPQARVFAMIGYVPSERIVGDRDHDGLLDDVDSCPNEPEDVDFFEDKNGCPDPDNDGDGIPDTADRCPNGPEDRDNFADSDGCPDEDNDGDTIPDTADKCPAELETVNGYLDEDGCPDTPPTVFVTGDRIVIMQKVFFKKGTATILDKSKRVLDDVAKILNEHPEIARVSVEGHTSSEGNAKTNKQLSQWRAATIVNYLVKQKVDRKRLTSAGWGSEKPLTALPEKNDEERETNRRVEFLILETRAAPGSPTP